jgi:tetratricopeptide (TPR) repeat protein
VFLAAMILAFHLSLMIWKYRPLRYQMVLIYPFCAGAAILIATLWRGWRKPAGEKVHWVFWPACAIMAVIPSYQLFAGFNEVIEGDWWASMARFGVPLSAPVFALIIGLIVSRARTHGLSYRPVPARLLAACLIVGALFGSVKSYIDWAFRPTFTIRDVNRDIALNVSPGALITGPYAQALTIENSVPALIHMFGTVRPDPEFFKRFPITHLLLDDGNIGWLSKDYPAVLDRHEHICTYFIGETKVRLVNVAGIADNPVAAAYRRSPLEETVIAYRLNDMARARAAIATFVERNPFSYAGDLHLFEMTNAAGDFDAAEAALKKAVEFSPTSYVLKVRLGRFYRDLARELKRPELRDLAARYYKEAVDLAPTAERTVDEYRRFLESKE